MGTLSVFRRIVIGLLAALAGVIGYVIPTIRNVEVLMPYHDVVTPAPAA